MTTQNKDKRTTLDRKNDVGEKMRKIRAPVYLEEKRAKRREVDEKRGLVYLEMEGVKKRRNWRKDNFYVFGSGICRREEREGRDEKVSAFENKESRREEKLNTREAECIWQWKE